MVRDLVYVRDEVCSLHSDATHEMGWLQLCLKAIQVALSASERETAATRATAADA
jgi:hypothetical protein